MHLRHYGIDEQDSTEKSERLKEKERSIRAFLFSCIKMMLHLMTTGLLLGYVWLE